MEIDAQVRFAVARIPGMEVVQTKRLFEEAFARNSSVVIGGSRIRYALGKGVYRMDSDLDVGFGSLTRSQAGRIITLLNALGPLVLEKTRIVPGNQTVHIPMIVSPEEFFQRSGIRGPADPMAGQPFEASGSYSFHPDGSITVTPPGGPAMVLPVGTF